MYRLYNPNSGEHFYTAEAAERDHLAELGWHYEGIAWIAPISSNTPVYRMYNANGGEHHYTLDAEERDMLVAAGWNDEGIGWYSDDNMTVPLYRQYNPNAFSCNHNYTASQSENDYLISLGWLYEGIGWYGTASGTAGDIDPGEFNMYYNYGTPPTYMQTDSRWADNTYNGYTIAKTGCGICVIAMILSAIKQQEILPPEVAEYLTASGDYNSGDSNPDVWPMGNTGISHFTAAEHWGVHAEGLFSYDQYLNALKHGKLVGIIVQKGMFIGWDGSHELLIYGYNALNNTVRVIDPLTSWYNSRTYDVLTVYNEHATDPRDNDAGTSVFAMY